MQRAQQAHPGEEADRHQRPRDPARGGRGGGRLQGHRAPRRPTPGEPKGGPCWSPEERYPERGQNRCGDCDRDVTGRRKPASIDGERHPEPQKHREHREGAHRPRDPPRPASTHPRRHDDEEGEERGRCSGEPEGVVAAHPPRRRKQHASEDARGSERRLAALGGSQQVATVGRQPEHRVEERPRRRGDDERGIAGLRP